MRTIVFDLDDTLYDQIVPFQFATKEVLSSSFTDQEIESLYLLSRKYSDEVFEAQMKGEMTADQLQTYRITMACKELDYSIDETTALRFQEVYLSQQRKITLFPEVEILLNKLMRTDIQLAILTNGEYNHQLMKLNQLQIQRWIPEEHIFISGALGVSKPDTRVYKIVEEKLRAEKENLLYVGDSFPNDIVGAKNSGWQAIWFNHRKRSQPATSIYADAILEHPQELLEYFNNMQLVK